MPAPIAAPVSCCLHAERSALLDTTTLSWSMSRPRAATLLAASSIVLDRMAGGSLLNEHVEHRASGWRCRLCGMARMAVARATYVTPIYFRAFPHYRGSGPTGPHSEQASGGAWGAARAYNPARKDARPLYGLQNH